MDYKLLTGEGKEEVKEREGHVGACKLSWGFRASPLPPCLHSGGMTGWEGVEGGWVWVVVGGGAAAAGWWL